MFVYGRTEQQVRRVVESVSALFFDNNLIVKESRDESNSRGGRCQFTLRTVSGRGPGSRVTRSGAHYPIACWHAHYRVLERLADDYLRDNHTLDGFRVKTALTTYNPTSIADMREQMEQTRGHNVGSYMVPQYASEMCDCGW